MSTISPWPSTQAELSRHLRMHDIQPTLQRMAIASVLLRAPCHMTADQVLNEARTLESGLSRATVYSTLQLFVRQRLLRELPLEGESTVYDSNLTPHYHLYNVETGEVSDLPAQALQILGLPDLDAALEIEALDVIIRIRTRSDVLPRPVVDVS